MEMKDFETMWAEHEEIRMVFLVACESLYYTLLHHSDNADKVNDAMDRCNTALLTLKCADRDLKLCMEYEAMRSTYED